MSKLKFHFAKRRSLTADLSKHVSKHAIKVAGREVFWCCGTLCTEIGFRKHITEVSLDQDDVASPPCQTVAALCKIVTAICSA